MNNHFVEEKLNKNQYIGYFHIGVMEYFLELELQDKSVLDWNVFDHLLALFQNLKILVNFHFGENHFYLHI